MSKYRPLWEYIKQNSAQRLTFSQIQTILGFQIDHSFLNYKKELEEYGYIAGCKEKVLCPSF